MAPDLLILRIYHFWVKGFNCLIDDLSSFILNSKHFIWSRTLKLSTVNKQTDHSCTLMFQWPCLHISCKNFDIQKKLILPHLYKSHFAFYFISFPFSFAVLEVFTWRHQIQTKKLSILLIFYFHEVLQPSKTFIYTNFRFQRVLRFAIEDAWIFKLLPDAASSWRPGKLLCGLLNVADFLRFCYLNISCFGVNIT